MNCTFCGSPFTENAPFCERCAQSLPAAAKISPPEPGSPLSLGYAPQNFNLLPPNIPDYLVWAIITTFCCQPFGIAALVFSVMTMTDKTNGRFESAQKNSRLARTMITIGLIFWGLLMLFYLVVFVIAIIVEANKGR